MRIRIGSLAAATAITAALTCEPTASAAHQALMLNGIGGGAGLPDVVMANVLGGMFESYERHNVSWPQQARPITGPNGLSLGESVTVGADNLQAEIDAALARIGPGEHVTVVGLSAGALVADEVLRRLADDPDAPGKDELNFVVVGDSSRSPFNRNRFDPILRYSYSVPVDTEYDTTVVATQYDGFADFPDKPWNLVAVANAVAGQVLLHVPSMFTDLSDVPPASVTVSTNAEGGVTTRYFITPDRLPLVQIAPALGVFGEANLRKIIEAGYVRNPARSAAIEFPADDEEISPDTVSADADQGSRTETASPTLDTDDAAESKSSSSTRPSRARGRSQTIHASRPGDTGKRD